MVGGYMGKILNVDLDPSTISKKACQRNCYATLLGGLVWEPGLSLVGKRLGPTH